MWRAAVESAERVADAVILFAAVVAWLALELWVPVLLLISVGAAVVWWAG